MIGLGPGRIKKDLADPHLSQFFEGKKEFVMLATPASMTNSPAVSTIATVELVEPISQVAFRLVILGFIMPIYIANFRYNFADKTGVKRADAA